jgi:hypothetical protein
MSHCTNSDFLKASFYCIAGGVGVTYKRGLAFTYSSPLAARRS